MAGKVLFLDLSNDSGKALSLLKALSSEIRLTIKEAEGFFHLPTHLPISILAQ